MKTALSTVFVVFSALAASADGPVLGFESDADLANFQVSGSAVIDSARAHEGAASLRLDPGAFAEWKVADKDGAGFLDLWVYDNGKSPKDPKTNYRGPAWGLRQADGTVLAIGELFARYLVGDTTYTVAQVKTDNNWFANLQYLGETKRSEGWHRWTFLLDPEKGLSIALDGKDVNAVHPRFDWNKTSFAGMSSVVLYGAQPGPEAWPVWVDDVSAAVAGEMKAKPTPPPPPPPVVPETDPAAEKETKLLYPDLGAHPRLLFDAAGVERIRAYAKSPEAAKLMERLNELLDSSRVVPVEAKFLRDATEGQRQGLWRLPTVALHYVLTGEQADLDAVVGYLKVFQSLPHWETGAEMDSGMSSANICVGAALAFDWTYDALDPDFREAFRKTLWEKARAQYHGGHLCKNGGVHYWQNDPSNNHRWHRDAGLVLSALAAARGDASEQWLLGKIRDELDFLVQWLPEDGTSHESGSYLAFGGSHLVLALDAADRAFGTEYLKAPFFRTVAGFRMHSLLPGLKDGFSYGDGEGLGFYNNYLLRAAGANGLAADEALLFQFRDASPNAFYYAWMDLIWTDPELKPAEGVVLPTAAVFPDIGTLFVRDSWKDDAVAAMFRCSPFGGLTLNRFRNDGGKYINVAHDDPDANSFVIVKGDKYLAETDRYSHQKQSRSFNTVLVNGIGQEAFGRPEGGIWTQPAGGNADMTKMAWITGYTSEKNLTAIEGEAAGSYLALNDPRRNAQRPALDTFRRTFLWVEGRYILVLDSLKAPSEVTFDWLMQGHDDLRIIDEAALRFELVNGDAVCPFQVAATHPLAIALRESSADQQKKPLGWKQLVATATSPDLLVASVYAPWGGEANVALAVSDDGVATVTVGTDTWRWEPVEKADDGATRLQFNGKNVFPSSAE